MTDIFLALVAFFALLWIILPLVGISLFWMTGGFRRK